MLREGTDLTIISMGSMLGRSLRAVEELQAKGIAARLVEMHTLKPIDHETILRCAVETGAIVTAEEHSIIGGLSSAVAEVLTATCPVPQERVGINDYFCPTGRDLDKLMDACGLSIAAILSAAERALKRKK